MNREQSSEKIVFWAFVAIIAIGLLYAVFHPINN